MNRREFLGAGALVIGGAMAGVEDLITGPKPLVPVAFLPSVGMGDDWTSEADIGNLAGTKVTQLLPGPVFINSKNNTKNLRGLTIDQEGADDEILSLKSSDVAHGMTTVTETDTYAYAFKAHAGEGGLSLVGTSQGLASPVALRLNGFLGGAAGNGKSTTGVGVVELNAAVKSGTTVTDVAANGNMVTIANNGTVRFIFDADGDSYSYGAIYPGSGSAFQTTGYITADASGNLKLTGGNLSVKDFHFLRSYSKAYASDNTNLFKVTLPTNRGGLLIEVAYHILVPGVTNYSGIIVFTAYASTAPAASIDNSDAGTSKPNITVSGADFIVRSGVYVATVPPGSNNTIYMAIRVIGMGDLGSVLTFTEL